MPLDFGGRKFYNGECVLYNGPTLAWRGRIVTIEYLLRKRERDVRMYSVRFGRDRIYAREHELMEVH